MYKQVVRPILFKFQADAIHEYTIEKASKAARSKFWSGLTKTLYDFQSSSLSQELLGMTFRNPVGLAAGFDKNGMLAPIMQDLGLGFIEVGSITAKASSGNPKPRSFRLPADASLINRMGLNNDGAATITKRIEQEDVSIPIGINIAKTHRTDIIGELALEDYYESFQLASTVGDYITINISCPNTKEGKTFEQPEPLEKLLQRLLTKRDATAPPVFVKFSVDLDRVLLSELMDVSEKFVVNGYIATNTSVSREGLTTSKQNINNIGTGGLSGKAIFRRSNNIIHQIYEHTRGEKLIIGVGGIFSAEDAIEKIKAGADLVQIYTGLIYEGPSLVKKINKGILNYLNENNLNHIYQIRSS